MPLRLLLCLLCTLVTGSGCSSGGGEPPAPNVPPDTTTPPDTTPPPDTTAGGGNNGVNAAPVAGDDNAEATAGSSVEIAVLANDSDIDGELAPASITIVTPPANGTANLLSTGRLEYTPADGFEGADSLTYTVADTRGAVSAPATVMINVTLPTVRGEPPVAVSACFSTSQEVALTGQLTATDPDNAPNELTFRPDPNRPAPRGTVTIAADGSFNYSAANPGPRGIDRFGFVVEDPAGQSGTGAVTVVVDQKIMPLGDSITEGTEDEADRDPPLLVGYRQRLHQRLTEEGFNIDFVGRRKNGQNAGFSDPDNEGHFSATIPEITFTGSTPVDSNYPGVFGVLEANPPDIVLLHIGTNDLFFGSEDADNVVALLQEIQRWEDEGVNRNPVTVILARIIDLSPFGGRSASFNNALVQRVQTRINNGDDIIIVNQQDALNYPADMADEFHPGAAGYRKMADVWLFPLAGVGRQTGTGTADNTGAHTGPGILERCP